LNITVTKSDWLTALQCPRMAWHTLRAGADSPTETELFRMEQGQEIGILARKLFPSGVLVSGAPEKSAADLTKELVMEDESRVLFEPAFVAGQLIARADVLIRELAGWHVLEVKSSFSGTKDIKALLDDLAYTVMVINRAGEKVARASLILLSRDFCFGDDEEKLFQIVTKSEEVIARAVAFEQNADSIIEILSADEPPKATLVSACRSCSLFATECLGANIKHTVIEIPGLHHTKLKKLSDEGIVDVLSFPCDLPLNEAQERARQSMLSDAVFVSQNLRSALSPIQWPCSYLDFETVATTLPLYKEHACHQQVLTQFSVHQLDRVRSDPLHYEYLADADRDCERELAESLISVLGNFGSVIVYSSFEKTRITSLKQRFMDLAGPLDQILGRIFDLLPIIKDNIYHPAFRGSFSIKKVLPALVPELSYKNLDIRDGDTAIARFARMAKGGMAEDDIEKTRKSLLDYCCLDTFAMVRLHEALNEMAG